VLPRVLLPNTDRVADAARLECVVGPKFEAVRFVRSGIVAWGCPTGKGEK
jgi:hypothetical protein